MVASIAGVTHIFTYISVGSFHLNKKCLTTCNIGGIIELFNSTGEDIDGKHAVVIGRSNIVDKPVAEMLLSELLPLKEVGASIK